MLLFVLTSFPQAQGQTLKSVGVWLAEPVFSHGQLNVAVSRVGSREKIKFAIKPTEEGWDNFTSNVVYREVLLDSIQLQTDSANQQDFSDDVAVLLEPYSHSDLDYEGPHDEVVPETELEEDIDFKKPLPVKRNIPNKTRSASLPKNLATPEENVPRKRPLSSAAHEAWVASLPEPNTEELTEEEKEREAMVERRSQFFKKLFHKM